MEFNHFSKFELKAYIKYFTLMKKHAQDAEKQILQTFINSINITNDAI